MPSLERTYIDYDLALLRCIAAELGVMLGAGNPRDAAEELAAGVFDPETIDLAILKLDDDAREALGALLAHNGSMPTTVFERRFGEIRPLGAAAREREQPWTNPANATEALYYHGLIGRAFLPGSGSAPAEYIYIPDELLDVLPGFDLPMVDIETSLAPREAPGDFARASSAIVDDATTVLAWLRRTEPERLAALDRRPLVDFLMKPAALDFVLALLRVAGIVTAEPLRPVADELRAYLEATRGQQLTRLIRAWRDAAGYDDLAHVPGLILDPGGAERNPVATRVQLLQWLHELTPGVWYSQADFIASVRANAPDFQRPGGRYDRLYIRREADSAFLFGIEHWPNVEGALLAYLISGPLHWLGMADVTSPQAGEALFRLTERVFVPTASDEPVIIKTPPQSLQAREDGVIYASRAVDPAVRFQLARIADWLPDRQEQYLYQVSGASLAQAEANGVSVSQVLSFLRRTLPEPPLDLIQAIERYGHEGAEVRVGMAPVLRVTDAEILDRLRRTPAIARMLGETLGPTAVLVQPRFWGALQAELLKQGIVLVVDD